MEFLRSAAGFTIIEMLMVIVLVAILSSVALPMFLNFKDDAKTAVTNQKLSDLKMAITGDPRAVANGSYLQPGFEKQVGQLPATLNSLVAQGAYVLYNPFTKIGWRGPYVNSTDPSWNLDSWGIAIQYSSAARTLKSCGKDKVCGNADDITVSF